MTRGETLAWALAFEGGALLLAFGLGAALDAPPFEALRPGWGGTAAGAAVGAGLFAALVALARSGAAWFERLDRTVREVVGRLFERSRTIDLAIVSALAGIAEEALFRGVVQAALADAWGTAPAVAAAAVLFGLAHFVTAAYAVAGVVVGIVLGALFATTGDLTAPIVAHATYDFAALVWLLRFRRAPSARQEPGDASDR